MKQVLLTAIIVLGATMAFAQGDFKEGHINYTISASGNEQMSQMMDGSTKNISIKDSMSRTDMNMSMLTSSTIVNSNTKKGTMLMDMMGNKYAVALSPDDIKEQTTKAVGGDYDVKYVDSNKVIAGHICNKAIITTKSDKKQFTIWYASDINIPGDVSNPYSKLKGLPLEYEVEQGPVHLKVTCTLIDNKPVDDSIFKIPDGYTTMTMDQLKQSMGGH